MSEGGTPEKPWWMALLKEASGAAVFLYAAGFLSTRSWLNLLGVWSAPPLVDQTYLAEGVAFFVATAEKLLFPWMFVGILGTLVVAGGIRAWKAVRRPPNAPLNDRPKVPPTVALLGTLSLLAVLLKLIDARMLEPLREPQSILLTTPRPVLRSPDEYTLCVAVVAALALAWLTLRRRWVQLGRGEMLVRSAVLGLLVFAALLLPMNFARTARSRLAPVARLVHVGDKSTPAHPVFLLLITDKELIVHDGESVSTLDPKDVHAIEILCHASILGAPVCPGRSGADRAAAFGDGGRGSTEPPASTSSD